MIVNKWIAMCNSKTDFDRITGFVMISVQVAHSSDKRYNLAKISLDQIGNEERLILPPQIRKKGYQLIIRVFRGEKLKNLDGLLSGKSDPYLRIKIDGFKNKTRVISNNLNPE